MKIAIGLWITLFSFFVQAASLTESLDTLPVQDGGRIKPFDTFARESLQMINGKDKFKLATGKGGARPATEIIMTWLLQPTAWQDTPLFELNYGELKKSLKLADDRKYFSFNELMGNERLPSLMQEMASKRESKEKLDPFFQALQRLDTQLYTFKAIASGDALRLVPPKEGDKWLSLAQLEGELHDGFVGITKAFIPILGVATGDVSGEDLKTAKEGLAQAVEKFKASARNANPQLYPSDKLMNAELHYNHFHPFKWSWILYLLGGVSCFLAWILAKDSLYKPAWVLIILGFLLHNYGFGLRVYLTGRAPVSNMYETVVWVGYGTVLFAMIIEYIYRWRFILLAGSLVAGFCLILADSAPVVLDPTLQPLEPVLRNNFWLLVHVLTITISYAAFFLAFALGDIGLVYYLKDEVGNKEKLKAITLAIYRSMQIGVSLLGPGIILGGIWADYSWGRFWGWDPKETWALIAFLGYLAVLHGRVGGWIKDFGMVAFAVVTFSLVIMAWYGVNFVLGAGLHSYGFGAGGVEYVSVFVAIHLLLVIFTTVVRFGRLKKAA